MNKKELEMLENISEVKVMWRGKNRKRSRMVQVLADADIGITLRSKREIYLCVICPGSPKWKSKFNNKKAQADFDFYGKAILSGFIDLTIPSPYDNKWCHTSKISEDFCAFS